MASGDDPIVVTGTGLITPVGHDSVTASCAIRAGISRFQEIENFLTPSGAGAVGGMAYGLTDDRSGSDRLLAMAVPAAQEAFFMAEEFYESLDCRKSRLFLCLGPDERPRYEDFDADDLDILLTETELEGLLASVDISRAGQAGGIGALEKAVALLREGILQSCIVGAVDSLVEYPAINWLAGSGRLKTDDNPDGLIPGEAAAFLVLEAESAARHRGAPALARIVSPTVTKESASIFSIQPLRGVGLSAAVNGTLRSREAADSGSADLHGIICDLNGEYYRAKEWGLAMPMIFEGSGPLPELWHPAENIADAGAASAIVFVAVAVAAIRGGYFPGPNVLVWASSDAGDRGSVLVAATAKTRPR